MVRRLQCGILRGGKRLGLRHQCRAWQAAKGDMGYLEKPSSWEAENTQEAVLVGSPPTQLAREKDSHHPEKHRWTGRGGTAWPGEDIKQLLWNGGKKGEMGNGRDFH